jgi:hypothetical protein
MLRMGEAISERLADHLERVKSLEPVIRAHADQSERESRLAPPIVEALHQAGLFRIFLPGEMAGGDLTIPESLRFDASTGWNLGQEIERCWRDLHTLSQHVILGSGRYEVIGRIMLGLDPASPII